jgi:hypothetical protein
VGPTCRFLSLLPIFPNPPHLRRINKEITSRRCRPWPELRPRSAMAGVRTRAAPSRISWAARRLSDSGARPAPRRSWGARRSRPSHPRAVAPSPGRRSSMRTRPSLAAAVAASGLQTPEPLILPRTDHRGARPELGKTTRPRLIHGTVARFLRRRCYGRRGCEVYMLNGASQSSERRRFDAGHG